MTRYIFDLDRAIALGLFIPPDPASPPASGSPAAVAQLPANTTPLGQAWTRLLGLLKYSDSQSDVGQREVLQFIKDNSGVTLHAISDHFKTTPNAISGIINGGLQRNIKKAGFAEIDPVLRLVKEGGTWHYYAGVVLQAQPAIPSRAPSKPKK